jgi:transcription initiation factor TFIIIB Brf1 subunit/transcription initiation factor TFIIB
MNLVCDLCGSNNIADSGQEYVCRDCGVVLTIQKLQYDRPYNDDILQHSARFGSTQIGTAKERSISPDSYRLKRLNKHNSQLNGREYSERKAFAEIKRIFDCLGLGESNKEIVMKRFKEIHPQLVRGSKYKNPEKLSAILIYVVLKLENIAVKRKDIVSNSNLSKEEFNNFIFQVRKFLPEYTRRNRQNYIMQKLMAITEHFGLEMSFYFFSKKILYKLWESIKNTTDDVIAGLVTSITALCDYKDEVKVSSICDLLNIKMSTIQFQVKKRIFEKFRVPGFISLVRSSDLLKGFLRKVGLLEGEELNAEVVSKKTPENVVDIKLGDAERIFNPLNDLYLIGSSSDNGTITLAYLEIYNNEYNHDLIPRSKKK